MQRTKKAKGQMVRRRGMEGRRREREREMRGREEKKEEGATRLHRSRSTVC